jgi:hypothetical protein
MRIPNTVSRVADHTPAPVNERIRRQIEENVAMFGNAGPEILDRRLQELDREWDIERVLETNAATVMLLGALFSVTKNRAWFLLSAISAGFLLQHAVQGWCPPVIWFRRLGFRTASEIDYERYALKALRGDFRSLPDRGGNGRFAVGAILDAVKR